MGMMIDVGELLKAMDTWDKFGNDPNKGLIPLRTPALQDRYVPYVKYDDMVKCVKGMPTVEAIPKDQYEAKLKADLGAILVELQMEIHELENPYPHDYDNLLPLAQHNAFYDAKSTIEDLVDEKIKSL